MKQLKYTIPYPEYDAKRACLLNYKGTVIAKLVECVNRYEGDKGYIFILDYDGISEAKKLGFSDIPGINHELALPQYNRFNMLPSFLDFRFIPIDRPDWQYHYAKFGLKNNQDQWELMIRAKGRCKEDPIQVERCEI